MMVINPGMIKLLCTFSATQVFTRDDDDDIQIGYLHRQNQILDFKQQDDAIEVMYAGFRRTLVQPGDWILRNYRGIIQSVITDNDFKERFEETDEDTWKCLHLSSTQEKT